jgi:hypothetical protein
MMAGDQSGKGKADLKQLYRELGAAHKKGTLDGMGLYLYGIVLRYVIHSRALLAMY